MAVAGAHRIAIDAGCSDLGSASTFNGLVNAQHDGSCWNKHRHQEMQENATGAQTRPDGSVEDAVIGLKMLLLTQADGAQHTAHHATTRGHSGPDDQQRDVAPAATCIGSDGGCPSSRFMRLHARWT